MLHPLGRAAVKRGGFHRGCKKMRLFRNVLLAVVAITVFAASAVPAQAKVHHNHKVRHHHHRRSLLRFSTQNGPAHCRAFFLREIHRLGQEAP